MTHGHTSGRLRSWSVPQDGRKRLIINWLAAILVPPATALFIHFFDTAFGVGSKSALFLIAVLGVSLLGGVSTALVSAVISGLLLNFLFVAPRYSFTIGETDNALTILMMMVTAVAVAALVDAAATRARQARRASREAELLALFAGGVLVNSDLSALLERVRTTYNQTAVSLLCAEGPAVASVGRTHPRGSRRQIRYSGWTMARMRWRSTGHRCRRVMPGCCRWSREPQSVWCVPHAWPRRRRRLRSCRGGQTAPGAALGSQPRPAHATGCRQGSGVESA